MSKSTVSQHDILSVIEYLLEDDLNYIQQKVKIASDRLLEHVNCTKDIVEFFDRDCISDCIKFAFADEYNSTSIDEVLETSQLNFGSFRDFLKYKSSLSRTKRNASVRFINQIRNVSANDHDLPNKSSYLKRYNRISTTHTIVLVLLNIFTRNESVRLSQKAFFDKTIEKITYAVFVLGNCKIILEFLKDRFSLVRSTSKFVSNAVAFFGWVNCKDFLQFWETQGFRETQNIVNALVSTIEDRDKFLFFLANFLPISEACSIKSKKLEYDFEFDLLLPSILFILQRTEAASLALDVLKTKTLHKFLNTQEVSKTWEMIKEGKEKIRLDEISEQLNQNDEKATVLVYQIDSNGILHCCLLNGGVKLFTFPQADKKALISQMQILLKPCDVRLPRSVCFSNHLKEDMNTSNNTSKLKLAHKRYQPDKMTNKSETQSLLQISTSKLKNLNAKWAAKNLYNILLKPFKDSLKGEKLIIIPDQHLFFLPFSSLVDENGNLLSMNFRIQIVPTLHYLLSSLANTVDSESIGPAMFVGNPNLDHICQDGKPLMPPLPHATNEARQLASLFNVNPLTENDATKSRVYKNLKQVSIFHVASHAEPTFGWIYFAPDFDFELAEVNKTHAYLLHEYDFQFLDLRKVRLVFLSCCNTGRGEVTSDGIFGIARVFLSAGARSVIITLWPVDDDITLEFTHIFYTYLCQEKSVCESLQLTMKHFQTSENQYYKMFRSWAPFQVLGEDVRFTKEELDKIRELGTLI